MYFYQVVPNFYPYLNVGCKSIFELYKNPVQEIEFYKEFCDVINHFLKTLVGEIIGY